MHHTNVMRKTRKIVVSVLLILSCLILVVGTIAVFLITKDANMDPTRLPAPARVTFYDKNNAPIKQNDYAKIDEISEHIKNAFIAVEDKRFYHHNGIDAKRIVGALFEDIKSGEFTQGGSTITCQLVKNTHLSNEKTIERKLKESKIALQIERNYSKDTILEMYLNAIYFGKGITGLKTAALTYFNKTTEEITPREAATLAAIVANPAKYSPIDKLKDNQRRADMILRLMHEQGYLSDDDFQKAKSEKIVINYNNFHNYYSKIYYNSALSELSEYLKTKKKDGLRVYTYFDPDLTKLIEKSIEEYSRYSAVSPAVDFLVAENENGGVSAYLSNANSFQRKRQPGSLLKPFIYATAMREGLLIPSTPINDSPTDFGGYAPSNYKNTHYGWVDAKFALSHSLNVPAVSVLQKTGVCKVAYNLRNLGISLSKQDENLALALGGTTHGSTLTEIATGYMTLANYGVRQDLSFIRKVEDAVGNTIYSRNYSNKLVLSRESAYLTTSMLKECAKHGTAKQLSQLSFDVAAKTGTVGNNNGNSDAWCASYTFVCRYSGNKKDNLLPENITGGNLPTKTVRAVLRKSYSKKEPEPFQKPFGIKTVKIDQIVKQELHKIVPYPVNSFGKSETLLTTISYTFDSIDPDQLFFRDLTLDQTKNGALLHCKELENVDYTVYLNGIECPKTRNGFFMKKQPFPLAKLEIVCSKDGRNLYQKTKIVRIGQSLITSSESSASAINDS